MPFDGSQVNILIAFIGGIITFFASCFLPLVPTYLAYLSGIGVPSSSKKELFINGLIFTLGFIFVFVLLGLTANSFGHILAVNRLFIQKIGGILFLLIGAFMTGLIHPLALSKEFRINLPAEPTKWHKINSLLVGLTFGFAWTPCIGPVLAVILFWASQAATSLLGAVLLLAYGVGLGIPFLIIALGFEKIIPKISKMARLGKILQIISGLIIIGVGVLLILGKVDVVSIQIIRLFGLDERAV